VLKAKQIETGIPELGHIINANDFQAVGMLIVQPQSQAPKVLRHFILAFQEKDPRFPRKRPKSNENSHQWWKEHTTWLPWSELVEQLSGLLNHHGVNWRMGRSDHVAITTRSTNTITLKLEQWQSSE
jgi:hypothetical protein